MSFSQTNYNPQPYGADGDTTGPRNLEYYLSKMLPTIDKYLSKGIKSQGLDLGCGNGRFNKLVNQYFESLLCVDPIENLDSRFSYDNVKFENTHLHEITGKYDTILMVGSMDSIWKTYGEESLKYIDNLLNDAGLVFVIVDKKNSIDYTINGLKLVENFLTDDGETKLLILKKEKRLITIRADENIGGYTKYTIPQLKKYAKKWGADFKLLSNESMCKVGNGKFHYRILGLYTLLDEYDVILNLDADMIITKNCPNPFDVLDSDKVCTIFEDKGSRKNDRIGRLQEIQREYGNIGLVEGYINTGFFMVSKKHKDIFKVDDETNLWTGRGFDDTYLRYKIKELGFDINEVSFKFNHMTMFSEPWNGGRSRFDSNIIHYAGAGIFDGAPTKEKQIIRDSETVNKS